MAPTLGFELALNTSLKDPPVTTIHDIMLPFGKWEMLFPTAAECLYIGNFEEKNLSIYTFPV